MGRETADRDMAQALTQTGLRRALIVEITGLLRLVADSSKLAQVALRCMARVGAGSSTS